MNDITDKGLLSTISPYSTKQTADILEKVLQENGMKLFSRIDHAHAAASVGLQLRPTELLIFGNPQAGTPLMQCSQSAAIDFPQKALIWEDEKGVVRISFNDPQYLLDRHRIEDQSELAKKMTAALKGFADAVTAQ